MRAVVAHGIGDFRLEERPVPEVGPEDVLVRVAFCGVCGTDIHMFHGRWELKQGATPGHEVSGLVAEVGGGVKGLSAGDRVAIDPGITCGLCEYCRSGRLNLCVARYGIFHYRGGGFAELVSVPYRQVYRVPDGLSLECGALMEPACCCLHGADRAAVQPGESVAILGGGAIGLMLLQLALLAGASTVVLCEPQAQRRNLALELGAAACVEPGKEDAVEAVRSVTGGGAEVVFESAGLGTTVEQSLRMARRGGRIVLFGVNDPDTRVAFSPYQVFRDEITILGSTLTNNAYPRVLALMAAERLRLKPLISHVLPLSRFAEAMSLHERREGIKVLIAPDRG